MKNFVSSSRPDLSSLPQLSTSRVNRVYFRLRQPTLRLHLRNHFPRHLQQEQWKLWGGSKIFVVRETETHIVDWLAHFDVLFENSRLVERVISVSTDPPPARQAKPLFKARSSFLGLVFSGLMSFVEKCHRLEMSHHLPTFSRLSLSLPSPPHDIVDYMMKSKL